MHSPQRAVLLAVLLTASALLGSQAAGAPAPQYNPTYGPSPSDLYYHFGYTTNSLLANWAFNGNGGGAGTTFTDLSGNGNTGTLAGIQTVTNMAAQGYPAAPVGGGLYFGGASGTGNYIGVPYNAQFGGMNDITVSAWVYFPSGFTASSITQKSDIFSLWGSTADNQIWQFGFGYALPTWLAFSLASDNNCDTPYYWTANSAGTIGPIATPGKWELLTYSYDGGSGNTIDGAWSMAANGVVFAAGPTNAGAWDDPRPLPAVVVGQMLELAGGTNGWLGGLADLAVWNCALSGSDSSGSAGDYAPTLSSKPAGEIAALYNTPMYGTTAGNGTALNAYSALAMNQLFTIYAQQNPAAPAAVTTANGTLEWKYVASSLTAGSGVAGQLANGIYFVQLDSAGGGVESVIPGDANLDGQVDVNDLTIVLSHFGQTGATWGTGDFLGDGRVDINDLTIVLAKFGQSVGAGSLAAVPEPSSVVLLAAVALSAVWAIRRGRRVA